MLRDDEETLMRYEIKAQKDSEDTEEEGETPKKYGWRRVGIMKRPAVVIKGMAFGSEEEQEMAFADDLKLRIAAPLCVPMVIPRKAITGEDGQEEFNEGKPFEVEFTPENIEEMLVKFMADPTNLIDMFDYEHEYEVDMDKSKILPCYLLEIWIVGKQPLKDRSFSEFGVRVPVGTVFAVIQFTDAEVFRKLVSEGCTGLSVQGRFGLELQLGEEQEVAVQNYADVLVMDKDDKVLMLKRREDDEFEPNVWGLAGGKIEEGEDPKTAAQRELKEEADLDISELEEVDVIENEDGSKSYYFKASLKEGEDAVVISEEHSEHGFFSAEELKTLPVIMRQNERFIQLVIKSINNKNSEKMEEGQEFEVGGKMYVIKDGKPCLKDEAEVAASAEATTDKPEDKEKEAEVAAAAEAPVGGGMTEEQMVELVKKTVAPMIEEAMAAVVEATTKEEDAEKNGGKDGKEAEMAYNAEGTGGKGSFMDFLKLPNAKTR